MIPAISSPYPISKGPLKAFSDHRQEVSICSFPDASHGSCERIGWRMHSHLRPVLGTNNYCFKFEELLLCEPGFWRRAFSRDSTLMSVGFVRRQTSFILPGGRYLGNKRQAEIYNSVYSQEAASRA